jgi:phosphohistidine phosphatase
MSLQAIIADLVAKGNKVVIVARHATRPALPWEDGWDGITPNFSCPLTKSGEEQALRMGELLKSEGVMPDLIVVSPSFRSQQTGMGIVEGLEYRGHGGHTGDGYNCGMNMWEPEDELIIHEVSWLKPEIELPLLVGHAETIETLTGIGKAEFSAGTIAVVSFSAKNWNEITPRTGEIVWQTVA